MTKITANIILLIMAVTWAYLSVTSQQLLAVSDQFILLAMALASGEGVAFLAKRKST